MRHALRLAARAEGHVEPNPMVGCVLVREGQLLSEGWHQRYGGPHAEREALAHLPSSVDPAGATWYVTLEPCCHFGKTPPCTDAVIAARPARVVVALRDPFPQVSGQGIARLEAAGIPVTVGVCEADARRLLAPYLTRIVHKRPWVIAKWAMTLDGKIATRLYDSRWISSEISRQRVHQLRGRVDAIGVGSGTALADDPLLTARPAGPRVATRIVFDRRARLRIDSQLVRSARQYPLVVVVGADVDAVHLRHFEAAGVDVLREKTCKPGESLRLTLEELASRGMTNLLLEGGSGLLGQFFEDDLIDEVWAFVAPKLVGGAGAPGPVGGLGLDRVDQSPDFEPLRCESLGPDVLVTTRRRR